MMTVRTFEEMYRSINTNHKLKALKIPFLIENQFFIKDNIYNFEDMDTVEELLRFFQKERTKGINSKFDRELVKVLADKWFCDCCDDGPVVHNYCEACGSGYCDKHWKEIGVKWEDINGKEWNTCSQCKEDYDIGDWTIEKRKDNESK